MVKKIFLTSLIVFAVSVVTAGNTEQGKRKNNFSIYFDSPLFF